MKNLRSIMAAAAFALAAALPASAEVNYHHGMIVFANQTPDTVTIQVKSIFGEHSHIEVAPRSTYVINACCILAGTSYRIVTYRHAPSPHGGNHYLEVTPHLCNRNGVPFGYAKIAQDEWNWLHEVDKTSCPT